MTVLIFDSIRYSQKRPVGLYLQQVFSFLGKIGSSFFEYKCWVTALHQLKSTKKQGDIKKVAVQGIPIEWNGGNITSNQSVKSPWIHATVQPHIEIGDDKKEE